MKRYTCQQVHGGIDRHGYKYEYGYVYCESKLVTVANNLRSTVSLDVNIDIDFCIID